MCSVVSYELNFEWLCTVQTLRLSLKLDAISENCVASFLESLSLKKIVCGFFIEIF